MHRRSVLALSGPLTTRAMPARQPCFTSSISLLQLHKQRLQTLHQIQHETVCPRTPSQRALARPRSGATSSTATAARTPPEETRTPEEPSPEADLDAEPDAAIEQFHVSAEEAGQRLDKVLAARFPSVSRTYLQTLLDNGNVQVNGLPARAKSRKAAQDAAVQVRFITPERELPITPENIPLDILYEDEHLIAINKPAGMVVHPAPGNWTGTVVHALTFHYEDIRALGGPRPGIVHRLDKGTSGVLIAARTARAHRGLTRLFAERGVRKEYLAITVGNPAGAGCVARTICEPVGRCARDRLKMGVVPVEAGGRRAVSRVYVEGRDGRGLLHAVRVEIETGRTHQIRVHMRHVGAPVLGDEVYGAVDVNWRFRGVAKRTMLHAWRIGFEHPVVGGVVEVEAGVAGDMRRVLEGVLGREGGLAAGVADLGDDGAGVDRVAEVAEAWRGCELGGGGEGCGRGEGRGVGVGGEGEGERGGHGEGC